MSNKLNQKIDLIKETSSPAPEIPSPQKLNKDITQANDEESCEDEIESLENEESLKNQITVLNFENRKLREELSIK